VLIAVAVQNYRSLRDLVVPLAGLTVITGGNGTGKSSLYRALRTLADCARGGAVAALAREGGLPSTVWAGPETVGRAVRAGDHPVTGTVRHRPVGVRLGFAADDLGYAVDLGLPPPRGQRSLFQLDPEIKREAVWSGPVLRPSALLADRDGPHVRLRDEAGRWHGSGRTLRPPDSMLSELADPVRAPELLDLRERMRAWRFYDHVRTDPGAPARQARVGTFTPVLASDGADLAAAWQTVHEVGDDVGLRAAVERAFPGGRVEVEVDSAGRFDLAVHQHGLLRPLRSAELSDGTLRYLLWVAALLTPRPPSLMVLNEPETSLHPQVLPALAATVAAAASRVQLVVVTHSRPLVTALEEAAQEQAATGRPDERVDLTTVELVKDFGETRVEGQGRFDAPLWAWPKR
jgi:predicted ATPase